MRSRRIGSCSVPCSETMASRNSSVTSKATPSARPRRCSSARRRPSGSDGALMNERILVVDDTPANIQTVAAILKGRGYQLSVATNGKQALEVVEKIRPDLILLDVMMPEMDGFETCQRIKSA